MLFSHRDFDVFRLLITTHQTSSLDVVTCFFINLSDRAVQVGLILIDLPSGKAPVSSFFPALH